MNASPSNYLRKRIVAVLTGLVALLSSSSLLPAAGENPVLQAKKAVAALEKVQWSKHEFIESLERNDPPPGDGPLSDAEKRANALHFLKANLKVEREKLAALKLLYEKLINSYTSVDHQANPTLGSLKRIDKIKREIDSTIDELAKPQEDAERLMRKLDPDREPPDSEKARKLFREVTREISRRAAQEVARNAARHAAEEASRQSARPEGHHHGPGGY